MTGAALQIDVWTPLRPRRRGSAVQHGVLPTPRVSPCRTESSGPWPTLHGSRRLGRLFVFLSLTWLKLPRSSGRMYAESE